MDIEKVKRLIEAEKINWSQHILERMHKRRIQIDEISYVRLLHNFQPLTAW